MNYKLLNLLIFIITWGLTSPAQAAASGQSLEQQTPQETQHLVCHKQVQHWLCDVDQSRGSQELAGNAGAVQQDRVTADSKSAPANAIQPVISSAQQRSIANIFIWLSYLLPCGLGLGFFLHYRYRIYRDVILQKQIETLEQLWQYGSDNDATSDAGQGTGS